MSISQGYKKREKRKISTVGDYLYILYNGGKVHTVVHSYSEGKETV